MIRYAMVVVAALVAMPCRAEDVPPGETTHGLPPQTCLPPRLPPFTLLASETRAELEVARQPIVDFQTATDTFTSCLSRAVLVLRGDWQNAHQAPNSTVEKAVDNVIATWERLKQIFIGGYNWQVKEFNKSLTSGDGDALVFVSLTPPPQWSAPLTAPPGPRLTLQSYVDRSTRSCANVFSDMSRRMGESGRVVVDYDVAADGTVQNVRIAQSSGYSRLDSGAVACVQQQTHLPAIGNGVPVASTGYVLEMNFSLHR